MRPILLSRTYALFILVLMISNSAYAQHELDSLYGVWKDDNQIDSLRVNAYENYIKKGFLFSNPDSALILSKALNEFAEKQNYSRAAALGYSIQGVAEFYRGNYHNALAYHNKSLEIQREIGDKRGIASSLNGMGSVHNMQGNYTRGLEYYKKSLAIREEIGDDQGIAVSLNNIGWVYHQQGNYNRSMEYYRKALAMKEAIGNKRSIAETLTNIGVNYNDQGNYNQALEYYEKAMAMKEEIGNKQGVAIDLSNIGVIYNRQGDYSRSLEYYKRSLAIKQDIGSRIDMPRDLNNMGLTYRSLSNYSQALVHCKQGLDLAEEIGQLLFQKDACRCLYLTYKDLGRGNEALAYLEKMRVIEDSLHAEETVKKLEQMEFAKQVLADSLQQVEKDLEVEMAHKAEVRKKDRNRNLAIGAGIFFLVISGGLYSRWHYVKKSNKIIQSEKDRSENLLLNILPHEIAEELKLKGSVDAQDFDQVSVLFTDFKGFTSRSEELTAKALVSEINECFMAFDHICEKYNIEKIKTIGDAYMAGGGLPAPSDDAVKNTVLAALEMQAFMVQRAVEKKANNEIPFEMRVGIHTGPVVAGIVGVKKFQYDIWGDTVNTASRVESSGEVGKVNISQATYDILNDDPDFVFEARGKIKAKGKGEIEMFFVEQSA